VTERDWNEETLVEILALDLLRILGYQFLEPAQVALERDEAVVLIEMKNHVLFQSFSKQSVGVWGEIKRGGCSIDLGQSETKSIGDHRSIFFLSIVASLTKTPKLFRFKRKMHRSPQLASCLLEGHDNLFHPPVRKFADLVCPE
jgi:hypothetical protein